MNPLEAIREWHGRLPKRIAGLVADRVLWAVTPKLPATRSADEALEKFEAWLSEDSDNPFYIAAKAATFRTVFELLLEDSFFQETWHKRAELLRGFLEHQPESEFARQSLQEQEFEAAQWRAQEEGWRKLVESSLSNTALYEYIDSVLRADINNIG